MPTPLRLRPDVWSLYDRLPLSVREPIAKFRYSGVWDEIPASRQDIVFVHVPKTGGTTLATAIFGRSVNHYPLWVWRAANPTKFAKATIVTVLRDPFDRLVSGLRHCLGGPRASDPDLAVGKWMIETKQCSGIDDMLRLYLTDPDVRSVLSRQLMFRPYQFWLGDEHQTSQRLICFKLVKPKHAAPPQG